MAQVYDPEASRDVRELRSWMYALIERVERLERMAERDDSVGAYLASRVDVAASGTDARPILDALGTECRAHAFNGRTMVTLAARALHDPANASMHALHPTNNASEIPLGYARYLAESVPGPNRWGSAVTRRVHTMLDWLKVNP